MSTQHPLVSVLYTCVVLNRPISTHQIILVTLEKKKPQEAIHFGYFFPGLSIFDADLNLDIFPSEKQLLSGTIQEVPVYYL